MAMRPPSARQVQAYELVQTMPYLEAAERMGITVDGVARLVTSYRRNTGTQRRYGQGPYAHQAAAAREAVRLRPILEARVAELERLTDPAMHLSDRIASLEATVEQGLTSIEAALSLMAETLDRLENRSPVVSHRRIADGGQRVRQQLRRTG
jgi:hypothetical protein